PYPGVEAMIIDETGPNIALAPAADPADGLLDLVLITEGDRDQLATHLDDRLAGRACRTLDLAVHRCRELTLTPSADCPIRIDDELYEPRPAINTLHLCGSSSSVEILVPRKA